MVPSPVDSQRLPRLVLVDTEKYTSWSFSEQLRATGARRTTSASTWSFRATTSTAGLRAVRGNLFGVT